MYQYIMSCRKTPIFSRGVQKAVIGPVPTISNEKSWDFCIRCGNMHDSDIMKSYLDLICFELSINELSTRILQIPSQ